MNVVEDPILYLFFKYLKTVVWDPSLFRWNSISIEEKRKLVYFAERSFDIINHGKLTEFRIKNGFYDKSKFISNIAQAAELTINRVLLEEILN
jgi:hypothetical protein